MNLKKGIFRKDIDMIHGKIWQKLMVFAFPVMLSSMLQLVFNAADVIIVGRFAGDESLAAVGSTGALVNLLLGLFMGLSIGANVVVAHAYGAGHKERVSKTLHTSVALSLICGVFLAILGLICSKKLLEWMGSPEDVTELAALYLRIYFVGMPASLLYNYGASILRAKGDTKTPLYFLFLSGVLNVILNLILVIVFHLGVAGVAIATVISQCLSALLILRYFIREKEELHFSLQKCRVDGEILMQMIRIGIPAGIQGMVFSLSNVVIQSSINSFGKDVIAANSAASNVEGFVYMAMNAVYQTSITFVGQNYGAGEHKRIRKVVLQCEIFVIIVGLVLGNAAYLFGDGLLHLYSNTDIVVEAGRVRLKYICVTYCLCGMMDTMVGALRGIGKSMTPMLVSIFGACVLRLIWIATVFQKYRQPEMLYVSYPITWIITFSVHVICFEIAYRKILQKSV